ncbi:MAG TPA: MFS transporter [Verrucomicrobiae bacterium]|jgi:MFS family permease|nr:MFS transporter [Verrucomicrobiae bacterium]
MSASTPTRGVFASAAFSRYFLGQSLSYVGDGLRTLAVPLLVFHLTNSAVALGGGLIAETLPFALFSVVGGSLADRVDRRRLMIYCDAVRCAVMVAFAVAYVTHHLSVPGIYCGLIVISISAAFFMGGQSSSLPYLLGKANATRGMSALLAAENTSNLVMPAIGAALFGLFGILPALIANAATYLASQFSLASIPSSLGPDKPVGVPSLRELIADTRIGFQFIFADRSMRAQATIGLSLNTLGFGGFSILIPFLKRDFGASTITVGLFFAVTAIGAILGSLAAGHVDRRWPFGKMITAAYIADAVLFLPVLFARNIWVVAAFWAISSGLAQFEVAQIIGWRLRVIPQELVGRVFGAIRLFVLCGLAPGVMFAAWMADRFGAHPAMTVVAWGFVVIAVAALASPVIRDEAR